MSTPQFPAPDGDGPVGAPSIPTVPGPSAPPVAPPAPPGSYRVPVGGYAAPMSGRAGGYQPPQGDPSRSVPASSRTTGVVALVLALVAAVVVPIAAGLVAYRIGVLLPGSTRIGVGSSFTDDLSVLTPARAQVLWAEILFWTGTALGIAAMVLGIIATARRRGRGPGIAAIVLSALGPFGYFLAVSVFLGIGAIATAAGGI
ncbi:hypothetical protein ACU045_09760 [Microbacterium sp. MAHUQ-60]|uniref:hypothetical protein n=1 Tax=unclassified Microbacterium TaxID=2609290 RepID=UPI00360AC7B4